MYLYIHIYISENIGSGALWPRVGEFQDEDNGTVSVLDLYMMNQSEGLLERRRGSSGDPLVSSGVPGASVESLRVPGSRTALGGSQWVPGEVCS